MAAADSFVGAALAPSPYSEAQAKLEDAERLIALYERVISKKDEQAAELVAKRHELNIALLHAKRAARTFEAQLKSAEDDNAFLRQVVRALIGRQSCGN